MTPELQAAITRNKAILSHVLTEASRISNQCKHTLSAEYHNRINTNPADYGNNYVTLEQINQRNALLLTFFDAVQKDPYYIYNKRFDFFLSSAALLDNDQGDRIVNEYRVRIRENPEYYGEDNVNISLEQLKNRLDLLNENLKNVDDNLEKTYILNKYTSLLQDPKTSPYLDLYNLKVSLKPELYGNNENAEDLTILQLKERCLLILDVSDPIVRATQEDLIEQYTKDGLFEKQNNRQTLYDSYKESLAAIKPIPRTATKLAKNEDTIAKILTQLGDNFEDLNNDSTLGNFTHSNNKLGGKNTIYKKNQKIKNYQTPGVFVYEQQEKPSYPRIRRKEEIKAPEENSLNRVKFIGDEILNQQKAFINQIIEEKENSFEGDDINKTFVNREKRKRIGASSSSPSKRK